MQAAALIGLALRSLWNRKGTALLTVLAIAVSTALLIGVEKVRTETRASFANTVSGVDLIVGARTGPMQLLLYSVFRIGGASNNISWRSYQDIAADPAVAWTIPLSLGDMHRGYRVLGTTGAYFRHFRYGAKRALAFQAGAPFDDVFDAVLGAETAEHLGYRLGDAIVISHGLGAAGLTQHDDKPFRVVGILARTGTPVDRTVHVSLKGIEAMHVDWRDGRRAQGTTVTADEAREMQLRPSQITAFMVGLESRLAAFAFQRKVNAHRREPLMAILPGAALQELWDLLGGAERALAIVAVAVAGGGLLAMTIMLIAGLAARRREMAILRAVGARPVQIFGLLVAEATALATAGAALGLGVVYAGFWIAQPIVEARFGLYLALTPPAPRELQLLAMVVGAGVLAGAVPAWLAVRRSLADGMIVRE